MLTGFWFKKWIMEVLSEKVYRLCGFGEGEVRVVESHSEKF